MSRELPGIHHVTAIAGDPQQNVDFYAGVLGLRLIKVTVNFDDPGTYHLYYGDEVGRPGTLLTFFPWPGAARGRRGTGQVTAVAFSIPAQAIDYWIDRLKRQTIDVRGPIAWFDEQVLAFDDPDGLPLELVAGPQADARTPWAGGPVPPASAIHGISTVTLTEAACEETAAFLTDTLGCGLVQREGSRVRFRMGAGGPGALVDVLCLPKPARGRVAVGSVHHVAWRTPDDESQRAWRQELATRGLDVTPVVDRQYFHSIYFREPGGVLFEIATDLPGFTVDEPAERLGTRLRLPPHLEPMRREIEQRLPPLRHVTAP